MSLLGQPGRQPPDEPRRHQAREQPADGPGQAHLDPPQVELVALPLEHDVVHAHDLAALDVDDLAVEHVAPEREQLAVGPVPLEGSEGGPLVEDDPALVGGQGRHLGPAQHRPRLALAHQEPVHRGVGGVHDHVLDAPEAPVVRVHDGEIENFRDVDHGPPAPPRVYFTPASLKTRA